MSALLLAGCASTSPSGQQAEPAPAPAQPTLQELMQQAQSAQTSGQRERARQAWRSAAKAYPTQKSPWQGLAQDYFEAADYGNAILAAQEVLQRDNQDTLAHSVLAVSGLRLSTVSLVALRDRGSYSVGSRDEALGLTRAMREALGDTPQAAPRAELPARSASPAPVAAAKAAAPPARVAAPVATPAATPAVNTVPAGAARNTSRAGAGGVVPVAATPATAPATTAAARPAVPSPASKATTAAPVSNPKPASADPFKLLN